MCKKLHFTSGLLQLPCKEEQFKDNRYVYQFLFLSTLFSGKSYLGMDQLGRLPKFLRMFQVNRFANRRYRNTVVSDTTLQTRLGTLDSVHPRRLNFHSLAQSQESGLVTNDAIVDGSGLGKGLYSCLGFITRWGDVFLTDAEKINKKGKELLSSEQLVRRCYEFRNRQPIDYLLLDALYFNERFYQLRQQGYVRELVIKYTPDSLNIGARFRQVLKRFEELVDIYEKKSHSKGRDHYLHRIGFSYEDGLDPSRNVSYRIYLAGNNSLDNRYQIARVKEYRHGHILQQFYVITTDKSLNGKEMRRLAHQRWYIENDGFKSFNAHVHSKRCWTHQEKEYLNLLLIQLLAFSLLVLFRREYGYQFARQYCTQRITLRFVSMILFTESFKGLNLQGS